MHYNSRRKKKCIRLLIQNQGHQRPDNYNQHAQASSSSSKESSSNSENLGHSNSYSYQSQRMLDPNPSINELRRLIPTIGMDKTTRRDGSFNKILHSPADSTSQSTGFETNSETSARSPSGLSSLPSIGSPSSITSPQTCTASSYYDSTIPISMFTNGSSGSNQHDWFRPNNSSGVEIPSAFKPLSSTTSSSSSSSITTSYRISSSPKGLSSSIAGSSSANYLFSSSGSNIFNSASFNGIMNMNSTSSSVINNQSNRTRVGADPRDAKNPLSISQLTGNSDVNDELENEERNSGKDFMNYSARVPLNGLTDLRETNSRSDNSRRDSVNDKLHRTFTAERISSLIV